MSVCSLVSELSLNAEHLMFLGLNSAKLLSENVRMKNVKINFIKVAPKA